MEEDDAFNQETFGTSTSDIRKDFDFGQGDSQQSETHAKASAPPAQTISYAQAATVPVNDDEFMQELWGSSNAPSKIMLIPLKTNQQAVNLRRKFCL